MPSPRVTSPGPFVVSPSPDLPVVTRWLLTSDEISEFERGVLYRCGSAQVGFSDLIYPPFIASPFLLVVNLVLSTAAHAPRWATL
jgi:poly-beta-hydroxyalkanoate depolymerase